MKFDDIGVGELSHDGHLLEELDLTSFIRVLFERLDSDVFGQLARCPLTFLNFTELSRTKETSDPAHVYVWEEMM